MLEGNNNDNKINDNGNNIKPTANDRSITTEKNKAIDVTLGGSISISNPDLIAIIAINPPQGTLNQINQQIAMVTDTLESGFA